MAGEAAVKIDVTKPERQGRKSRKSVGTHQRGRSKEAVGGPPHLRGVVHHPEIHIPYPAREFVLS